MSRTKRFLSGVSLGYASQVLVTTAGLWLTPFLLFRIGKHDYGLWLVGSQLLAYLTLMDFGIVALLPRATAYATGRAGSLLEATDLPEIIGKTTSVVLCQVPFVALAALLLWITMPNDWGALRMPIGIVMFSFVLVFPLRVFQAVLQGLQDLAFLGRLNIVAWFVGTLLTIGLVFMGLSLYALAFGWVVTQLVLASVCYLRLRSTFPGILPRRLPTLSWLEARGQLRQGLWVSVGQVAQVLVNGTDLLIIGTFLGPLAVVPYACTGKLIGALANQPQMLMQTAGPALSELKMAESQQKLFQVCTALSQAMLLVSGAVVCVVLTVNQGFVQWWVGKDQYGGLLLSASLLFVMLLRHWNTTAVYAIFCFGYERRISLTTLLDGVATVGGAILAVRLFGVVGAPIGALVGVCLVSLPLNLSALARESGVKLITLIRPLCPWFVRFIILAACGWSISKVFVPQSFASLVGSTLLCGFVYGAVMFPLVLRDPLGTYVRTPLCALQLKYRRLRSPRRANVS
jgi:O-antigen/teichoic acid export membrane protein